MRATSLLLLLAACSDYDINPKPDDPGGTDTGDGPGTDTDTDTTPPPGACDPAAADAIEVGLNDSCDVEFSEGSFTPVVEWELPGNNAYGPPIVGNLDDDNGDGFISAGDTPDVLIVTNTGGGLVAIDGSTGRIKWTSRVISDGLSQVAIGDVDGDGVPEIAGSNGTSEVVLMDNVGALKWRTAVRSVSGGATLYSALNPAIADMDNDGYAEIIAGSNILSYDGTLLGTGAYGIGACPNESSPQYLEGSISVPVDIDGDGNLEVVVGNAIYDMRGRARYTNGLDDGTVAVADFDLDGEPEFAVNSGNKVYTLETDLTPTGWTDTFNATNYVGPIAADDLDGDGTPEFIAVGSGEMRAYHWNGTRLWTVRVQDQSGAAGPILFDFEQDGYPEVVLADEEYVRVFNGLDGSIKLESGDHSSATLFETPAVADVDNDGQVEIIMTHGAGRFGVTVYGDAAGSWPAGRALWNQHAYSITNVDDDGGIPVTQTPNWSQYNNFRSGNAGLPPSTWNDVQPEVVEVCVDECPDRLYILVRVWNQGTEEVPAGVGLVVRAGEDGPVVATATTPAAIASGYSSEGITLEVVGADLGGARPFVDVDRDGALNSAITECVEDNNAMVVTELCE
ncbi:MAG: VCBS repeat-containing protein [Pseudomonadota bacterium]|nr:VCBS repeat-containing protein [Pseudomonadota bacterium]